MDREKRVCNSGHEPKLTPCRCSEKLLESSTSTENAGSGGENTDTKESLFKYSLKMRDGFAYSDENHLNKSLQRVTKQHSWSASNWGLLQLPGESTKCFERSCIRVILLYFKI